MVEGLKLEQWPHSIPAEKFMQHLLCAASKDYRKLEYPLYETTPMFSFWPPRPKWQKFGQFWEYVLLLEARKDRSNRSEPVQCPPIQLAYGVIDDKVLQVAYWSDVDLIH